MEVAFVWRKKGEALNPKNTLTTIKFASGSIKKRITLKQNAWGHNNPKHTASGQEMAGR